MLLLRALTAILCLCGGVDGKKTLVGSTVLGVDLGGGFMKAAYVAPGEEDPFPILLSDLSERKSANAIAQRKDRWLFGTHASKAAISNPDTTFMYAGSNLLGRPFESEEVRQYRERYIPGLEKDPERGGVLAKLGQGSVPVEQLVAMYLDNVKEHTEDVSLRHLAGAVLTVPAYYGQAQRKALLEAAEIAGVNVQALIIPASAGTTCYCSLF